MALTVLGLNFNTASLKIREQIHFRDSSLHKAYMRLQEKTHTPSIESAVILATCNRVEIYVYGEDHEAIFSEVLEFVADFHHIEKEEIVPFLYRMHGAPAVLHLFKVAAGLKSMVIGENQILSQIKKAYLLAKENHFAEGVLSRIFEQALAAGKRVRTETRINKGGTSIGSVAIDFVKELYEKNASFVVTLIGAGEIGEEVLKALSHHGNLHINLVNRNLEKAQLLGKRFNAESFPLTKRYELIAHSDVVISSVESHSYLILKKEFLEALHGKTKPIIFIDLSVPRSIEPTIETLEDMVLYTIDDLKEVINRNTQKRQSEIQASLEIINDLEEEFSLWETKRAFINFLEEFEGSPEELKHHAELHFMKQYSRPKGTSKSLLKQEMEKLTHHFLKKKHPDSQDS